MKVLVGLLVVSACAAQSISVTAPTASQTIADGTTQFTAKATLTSAPNAYGTFAMKDKLGAIDKQLEDLRLSQKRIEEELGRISNPRGRNRSITPH